LPPPRIFRFHDRGEAGSLRSLFSARWVPTPPFKAHHSREFSTNSMFPQFFAVYYRRNHLLADHHVPWNYDRLPSNSHRMVHGYRRNVMLILPTLLLLSNALSEIVCSPGPAMLRS